MAFGSRSGIRRARMIDYKERDWSKALILPRSRKN
jgi:hypothetical protein